MTKPLPAHTRRLAQLVNQPGGVTATEAVMAAEQSLEGLRERGLSEIASTIGRMYDVAGEIEGCQDETRGRELYALSNSLVGVAGVFGKGGLGEVALSFCTLVERLLLARQWEAQAIRLHLDSMRLLSDTSMSDAEIAQISAALRQVVDRLQPTPPQQRLN